MESMCEARYTVADSGGSAAAVPVLPVLLATFLLFESVRSEAPNALWSPEAKPLAGCGAVCSTTPILLRRTRLVFGKKPYHLWRVNGAFCLLGFREP